MIRRILLTAAIGLLLVLAAAWWQAAWAAPRDDIRAQVRALALDQGWDGAEWRCLDELVWRESRWLATAKNPRSSARGLFQILKQEPGLPVEHQAAAGFAYIERRYETPCAALAFHKRRGWY